MQERILEFCDLPSGHAGNTMAEIVYRVCNTYQIKLVLGSITTDNASDNRVMAATLSQLLNADGISWSATENHLACMAHIINLAAKQFLTTLKAEAPSRNETYAIEGLADELELQKSHVSGVAATLWRVRSFVKYICSSPRREASFEDARLYVAQKPVLKLIKDVTTRWNSTYYMVERILRLQDQVKVYIVRTKEVPHDVRLTSDDWVILDLLCKVLQPLELVSRLISATTKPTINQVWPSYMFIFQEMESWIANKEHHTESYYKELYKALSRAQEKLMQYYVASDGSYRYSIACLLDPEGKAEQLGHPDFSPESYIETLQAIYEDDESSNFSESEAYTTKNNHRDGSPGLLSKNKMNIASIRSVMTQKRPTKEKVDEVTRYLNEDVVGEVDNILLWWKNNHDYDSSIEEPYYNLIDKLRSEYDEAEAHEDEVIRHNFAQQSQSETVQNLARQGRPVSPSSASSTMQKNKQQTLPSMFKGKRKATTRMTYELDPGPARRKRTPFVEPEVENYAIAPTEEGNFRYLTDDNPIPVYSSSDSDIEPASEVFNQL
ncbi:protein of unknown function [Taphrina deformans PYCC 5710]|uniref:HAT C-terminal dimerisation domain-containing protein n=1 Tax=Taphrina deformans (strain PYCC 5710 / ATCC 11124 / CBS 356.35 / IMI 108563 / JCM 9778 / NBRC 8474) TaxID=1097556 RepID=R4XGS6_TAPDE|nr:protein of unknown function [Taphrina deformans PYCC 5710]|eukprot:CCG85092.1 protein of unknown function [Taphrina deformans PYCC 5710]